MNVNNLIKPINWKETTYGNATAYCGKIKVGWVKRSMSRAEEYYPTVMNDIVRLTIQSYKTMDEAKNAVEIAFSQVMNEILK